MGEARAAGIATAVDLSQGWTASMGGRSVDSYATTTIPAGLVPGAVVVAFLVASGAWSVGGNGAGVGIVVDTPMQRRLWSAAGGRHNRPPLRNLVVGGAHDGKDC